MRRFRRFLTNTVKWHRDTSTSRVQLLSDLHLEVGQQYSSFTFPASAPYLVLAGDIGRLIDYGPYLHFLEQQTSRYQRVFLVLGNHEFYGLSFESGIEQAQRLEGEPCLGGRLTLLHRVRWDDPASDLTILGCTLWSLVPDSARDVVSYRVSDFKHIDGWSVREHNDAHRQDVAWLREELSRCDGSRTQIMVATHYGPCLKGTSSPRHAASPWSSAFATDLLGEKCWARAKTWAFGHTHYSTDFVRNGTRVVANQRGYVLGGVRLDPSAARDGKRLRKHDCHEFDPSLAVTA